jgi:vitamin B12 transporter
MCARTILNIHFFLALLCFFPFNVWGNEPDETLTLLGQSQTADTVVGRLPRQLSHTAENTTVITAAEIEALNAHTLVDILATIPGIQLGNQVGSVNLTYAHIQGSNFSHVLVLLDGIPYNNLGDNFSDIGMIPARIIERVEIVKGAASSTWGQALGGVINVITKSPETEHKLGGMATIATGERGSNDAGGELSGTIDRFGYYLSGGYIGSGGFTPNTGFDSSNSHARLTWELPRQGQASLLLNYSRHDRGEFYVPNDAQGSDYARRLIIGGSLRQSLNSHLELKLEGFHSDDHTGINYTFFRDNQPPQAIKNSEQLSGGGARLLWRQSDNLMVVGVDFQHAMHYSNIPIVENDKLLLSRSADRWGFYLNDTWTIGTLSLSPGARYDLTGTSGDQFSPSFGATWQLSDNTLLRGYTANGYSLPSITFESGSEKVWTSQIGLETGAIPYVWLKGTIFRNDTQVITYDHQHHPNGTELQIRQGFEIETRTAPLNNISLHSGYSYVDARRSSDDSVVLDVPTHTLHIGVQYDNHKYFKGILTGRHIFWNAEPILNSSYHGLIWDLHLNATPFCGDFKRLELFLSLRNIFNGSQYLDEIYKNSGRWAEGGVRIRF